LFFPPENVLSELTTKRQRKLRASEFWIEEDGKLTEEVFELMLLLLLLKRKLKKLIKEDERERR
jgi:hypothetical protein